jgi:hypothetical protein
MYNAGVVYFIRSTYADESFLPCASRTFNPYQIIPIPNSEHGLRPRPAAQSPALDIGKGIGQDKVADGLDKDSVSILRGFRVIFCRGVGFDDPLLFLLGRNCEGVGCGFALRFGIVGRRLDW